MIISFAFIVFILNFIFSNEQFNYFKTLETNYTLINSTYSTVVISESKDLGACSCDLTPDSCDYLCCCDPNCPSKITSIWISDPNNICLDKKNTENDYLTHCFNENILFYFNRKRGMREYRDPVSNLFCVTFDNSSIMGQFYRDISALSKTTIDAIYKNYVDAQIKNYYYYQQDVDPIKTSLFTYSFGDYVRVKYGSTSNDFIFDGKFFIYKPGAFGDCVKNAPVRYMMPNEKATCGFKFKPFNTCAQYSWDTIISKNLTFSLSNNIYSTFKKPRLGNVIYRDYATGKLDVASNSSSVGPTTLTADSNGVDCTCNNLLETAEFNFVVDNNSNTITDIIINLILATSIRNTCNKNYVMSQTYSTLFINTYSDAYLRSGSPGYITGYKLLTAYNSTSSDGTKQFIVPREGTYVLGRKADGTCAELDNNKYYINSKIDNPILYGINSVYSCIKNFNLNEFKQFCENKAWKSYTLYSFPKNLQYVGIFGNANINYLKDWSEVIFDYNLDNSTWINANNTCYFPQSIFLDILTSKAGAVSNPQEYIVAARISVNYQKVSFLSQDGKKQLPFTFRFITNYVPLAEDLLTATRAAPSIIPNLPTDIVKPLVENN